MVTDFAKVVRINNFIEMLHRGECMIDSKANDISYNNGKSLADFHKRCTTNVFKQILVIYITYR
jgi:hypothetical protein